MNPCHILIKLILLNKESDFQDAFHFDLFLTTHAQNLTHRIFKTIALSLSEHFRVLANMVNMVNFSSVAFAR